MKKKGILALLVLNVAIMCLSTGCGVSHSSPEGVVKSLVKYSQKGNTKKVLNCYGMNDKQADENTKEEIQAVAAYYEAMKSQDIRIESCDIIEKYDDYDYVYVFYKVELSKNKEYPRVETYFVNKNGKKYNVIPTKDITSEMSSQAESAYQAFMDSDAYKQYLKDYDTFVLKNPNFEEELVLKLN
jgi:hypothetical protein